MSIRGLYTNIHNLNRGLRPQTPLFNAVYALSLNTNASEEVLEIEYLNDLKNFIAEQNSETDFLDNKIKPLVNTYATDLHFQPDEYKNTLDLLTDITQKLSKDYATQLAEDNKFKNIRHFVEVDKLTYANASGKYSHETHRVKKVKQIIPDANEEKPHHSTKYENIWFKKYCPNKTIALREVIGQEFLRLLIPYQPKTRLAKDPETGKIYVLSKGVEGAQAIQWMTTQSLRNNFMSGNYKGLGKMLMGSLFINEMDAKLGNMLLDSQNRLIKIDGDWCFGQLRNKLENREHIVSIEDLSNFPLLYNYSAHNWLDVTIEGKFNKRYNYAPDDVLMDVAAFTPEFRQQIDQEGNEILLSILLLGNDFIKRFIGAYTNNKNETELLAEEIARFSQNFRQIAFESHEFLNYLVTNINGEFVISEASKKTMEGFLKNIAQFVPMSKTPLGLPEEEEFRINFDAFGNEAIQIITALASANIADELGDNADEEVEELLAGFVLPDAPAPIVHRLETAIPSTTPESQKTLITPDLPVTPMVNLASPVIRIALAAQPVLPRELGDDFVLPAAPLGFGSNQQIPVPVGQVTTRSPLALPVRGRSIGQMSFMAKIDENPESEEDDEVDEKNVKKLGKP